MAYKFCILSAGKGTRNNSIDGIHKALLPIENKAVISHIIDKLQKDIDIVIAVGYKSEQIKTYLSLTQPNRNITYVDVENYDGEGSGPGLSLLLCEKYLQQPFIYTSVDTIVEENDNFEDFNNNWIGVSEINKFDSSSYCLVDGEKYLNKFYYGYGETAFIGLSGIYDYENFWKGLKVKAMVKNEYQVLNGYEYLDKIELKRFTWHDTGNNKSYNETRNKYCNEIVALKTNEAIYIENGYVIKYFSNKNIINQRLNRLEFLEDICPKAKLLNENMYYYPYIGGNTLSTVNDENILDEIIPFWYNKIGSYRFIKDDNFINNCKFMYHDKTYERCEYFKNKNIDNIKIINGIEVDNIYNMLNNINWDSIYEKAIPSKFHGDFQPENIICNETFKLIDWRQSFGDSLEIGDFYYDLGKLYHALLINGKDINNKLYKIKIKNNSANVSYHIRSNLLSLYNKLKNFCDENNYSWENIELLGALQYLGISSLYNDYHSGDYGNFLFLYGKFLLSKFIKK